MSGNNLVNSHDFCSETVDVLAVIDESCRNWMKEGCSPSPEEVNTWLKEEQRFRVFGRIQPS